MKRPYKVKYGTLVGVLASLMAGVMAALYLIPGTNCSLVWQEWIIVGGWTLIGVLLVYIAIRVYGNKFSSSLNYD
jgi:hypothetical protein